MFLVQAIADFEPEMALGTYGERKEAQEAEQKKAASQQEKQARKKMDQRLKQKGQQGQEDAQPEQQGQASQDKSEDADSEEDVEGEHQQEQSPEPEKGKRKRQEDHQQQFSQAEQTQSIVYLSFKKGDKIVTRQTFDNGWWYGNVLKKPDVLGYFPSNYVKVGTTAPLPEVPPEAEGKNDWMQDELKKLGGPIKSEYYQGITGYKMVKIDDKNKNILKGNYVKYDVASGLAKVPIKSQEPAAKAVRQMGYYFDYHDWCEQKNANPTPKSRPDPRKKRKKRLNLILFGEDKIKRKPQNQ